MFFFCPDGTSLNANDIPGQGRIGTMTEVICKINMTRNGYADCIKYVQMGEESPRAWVVLGEDLSRRCAFTSNLNVGVPVAFFEHTLLYSAKLRDEFQRIWEPKGKRWHRIFYCEKCVGCEVMYTTEVLRNGKSCGVGSKDWVFKSYRMRVKKLYGGIYCSFCFDRYSDSGERLFFFCCF